ncbi:MAG: DUF4199 domain-containing protein [Flammeovirgaceae bacterium]
MNKRILKTAVAVGALAAVICFIYLLVLAGFGENPFGKHKYMTIGFYGIFFAVAMWWYRDKLNNYVLRGRQALILGLLMNVISTIFYVGLIYFYLANTTSGAKVVEQYKAESLVKLDEMKRVYSKELSQEEYEQTKENINNFNPPSLAVQQVSFYHGSGVFLTFVFMLIFKHNPEGARPKKKD